MTSRAIQLDELIADLQERRGRFGGDVKVATLDGTAVGNVDGMSITHVARGLVNGSIVLFYDPECEE